MRKILLYIVGVFFLGLCLLSIWTFIYVMLLGCNGGCELAGGALLMFSFAGFIISTPLLIITVQDIRQINNKNNIIN